MKDLIVLVADKHIEAALSGMLKRHQALQCREINYQVLVNPQRDPGCFRRSHEFLRPMQNEYHFALVVFDKAWEGATAESPVEMEAVVRSRLAVSGWENRGDSIVIDPEVEAWIFGNSPHVNICLGWQDKIPTLREWLKEKGLWPDNSLKPLDPKSAFEQALRASNIPISSSIFAKLAQTVSLEQCLDPSFVRLRNRLQTWFPPINPYSFIEVLSPDAPL